MPVDRMAYLKGAFVVVLAGMVAIMIASGRLCLWQPAQAQAQSQTQDEFSPRLHPANLYEYLMPLTVGNVRYWCQVPRNWEMTVRWFEQVPESHQEPGPFRWNQAQITYAVDYLGRVEPNLLVFVDREGVVHAISQPYTLQIVKAPAAQPNCPTRPFRQPALKPQPQPTLQILPEKGD